MERLRATIRRLYWGRDNQARRFRIGLLVFDISIVAFFIYTTFIELARWILFVDVALGGLIAVDYLARLWIARSRWRHVAEPVAVADLLVIASLLAPAFMESFAFLRVMRALRLFRSYHVLGEMRERSPFIKRNEDVLQSVLNLLVFIFIVTALVYVLQVRVNPSIENYIDALYFTVTTLTTTGFGDITLMGTGGRLLAVVIMIVGISLFLRLLQTIFRPDKVRFMCPDCGLSRHDPDAVHCKHCGRVINIETEGV